MRKYSLAFDCFLQEKDLEEIVRQSLISQLETIKIDEDETKETIEQHQLKSLALSAEQEELMSQEQKKRMDAFEAKMNKMQQQQLAGKKGDGKDKTDAKIKKPHGADAKGVDDDSTTDSSDSDA